MPQRSVVPAPPHAPRSLPLRASLGLALGLATGALVLAGPSAPASADAPKDASAPVSGPQCALRGNAPAPKTIKLYDEATGGRVIAELTGAVLGLTVSDLPADPSKHRSRFVTSNGTPTLRIEGFGDASLLPLYTARDVSVTGTTVMMASAHRVTLEKAAPGALTVALAIAGTNSQSVRASAPCDAFTLERGTPKGLKVEGNERGYTTKKTTLDLYAEPGKDLALTLDMMEGTGQLFWSTETKAGYVHVRSRTDLVIDAWVKLSQLDPLKKGEMLDQLIPPVTKVSGATLALDGSPRVVKATKDLPVRARRDAKEKAIGTLETGAEVYVMETVAGWTNLLPKELGFLAPSDGGFWVPSSEVPK